METVSRQTRRAGKSFNLYLSLPARRVYELFNILNNESRLDVGCRFAKKINKASLYKLASTRDGLIVCKVLSIILNTHEFSSKNIFNTAFAVAPSDSRRGGVKINRIIDTRELYDSLPENIKRPAHSGNDKENTRQEKNSLNLLDNSWSDLDGNGIIDIVLVEDNSDKGIGTSVILSLINEEWKEIVRYK